MVGVAPKAEYTFEPSNGPPPEVVGLTPEVRHIYEPNISPPTDVPEPGKRQEGRIIAARCSSDQNFHRMNTVTWVIHGSSTGNGLPSIMQVAVLLRCEANKEFEHGSTLN